MDTLAYRSTHAAHIIESKNTAEKPSYKLSEVQVSAVLLQVARMKTVKSWRVGHKQIIIKTNDQKINLELDNDLLNMQALYWQYSLTKNQRMLLKQAIIDYQRVLVEWKKKVLLALRNDAMLQFADTLAKVANKAKHINLILLVVNKVQELGYLSEAIELNTEQKCYYAHAELHALKSTINAIKFLNEDPQVQHDLNLFCVINEAYLDCILQDVHARSYSAEQTEKMLNYLVTFSLLVAISGSILFLLTGNPLFVILSVFAAVILFTELFYLSRNLWYQLAPSYENLFKIMAAVVILTSCVLGPIIASVMNVSAIVVSQWQHIGHFMLLAIKGLALSGHGISLLITPASKRPTTENPSQVSWLYRTVGRVKNFFSWSCCPASTATQNTSPNPVPTPRDALLVRNY